MQKSVGNDDNSAATELVKAAEAITEAAARIEKAVPRILANKLGSQLANADTARKAIAKIVEPAMKKVAAATRYAAAGIDALKTRSDPKAPSDAMGAVQHGEVRAALRQMSMPERHKAIENAIAARDETYVSAAVSGSPSLSGVTVEQQQAAKERWRKVRHSDDAAKIAHLSNGITQLSRIAAMLPKWSDQLVEEPSAQTIAAAEATAARAKMASG